MRFNITTDQAHFIVNKDRRTVVCVINKTKYLFLKFAEENFKICPDCDYSYFSINHNYREERSHLENKLLMPNRFVGMATCSEDDEWDEEIGKTIAFSRAKDALLNSFYKRANTYVKELTKYLDSSIDMLNELGEKLSVNKHHRHEYINDLIGEQE